MLKRIIEHREYTQLRKDKMTRERMRQSLIVVAICLAVLLIVGVTEKTTPDPQPVAAPHVAKVLPQEAQDAERFATLVTMPVEQLDSDDLDFIGSKANNPCYEPYVQLPHDDMVNAIKACEVVR